MNPPVCRTPPADWHSPHSPCPRRACSPCYHPEHATQLSASSCSRRSAIRRQAVLTVWGGTGGVATGGGAALTVAGAAALTAAGIGCETFCCFAVVAGAAALTAAGIGCETFCCFAAAGACAPIGQKFCCAAYPSHSTRHNYRCRQLGLGRRYTRWICGSSSRGGCRPRRCELGRRCCPRGRSLLRL
jgi:hypothetical protein